MAPETAAAVRRGDAPKGDVIGTARIAGIQAAKRTAELIPLCHPLPLSFVDVRIEVRDDAVEIEAEARTSGQTGVEMEAMTAASVAALTVYDMVKGIERGVEIGEVVLLEKSGGRQDWSRPRLSPENLAHIEELYEAMSRHDIDALRALGRCAIPRPSLAQRAGHARDGRARGSGERDRLRRGPVRDLRPNRDRGPGGDRRLAPTR